VNARQSEVAQRGAHVGGVLLDLVARGWAAGPSSAAEVDGHAAEAVTQSLNLGVEHPPVGEPAPTAGVRRRGNRRP
jgi:hypothetical protein